METGNCADSTRKKYVCKVSGHPAVAPGAGRGMPEGSSVFAYRPRADFAAKTLYLFKASRVLNRYIVRSQKSIWRNHDTIYSSYIKGQNTIYSVLAGGLYLLAVELYIIQEPV